MTPAQLPDPLGEEREAYEASIAAWYAGDKAAARRLWLQYAAMHARRPVAMVERMERAKGLR